MKKLIFCFTLFIAIDATGQIDSSENIKAVDFINFALNEGNYIFEINDIEVPQEYIIIIQKYQQSITEKKVWFETFFNKNYKEGKVLPYHENFGITKSEYDKLISIDTAPKRLIIISEQAVMVNMDDSLLTFTGKGDFKLLDLIQVDFKKRAVLFADEHLPFAHSFTTTASSPFGIWTGYIWRKEKTNDSEAFNQFTSKIVAVCFGKTVVNDRLVLRITYKEVENGNAQGNLDLFGFLKESH